MASPQIIDLVGGYNAMLKDAYEAGMPRSAQDEAGPGYQESFKDIITGLSGKKQLNYPLQTALPGAGSSDFGVAAANAGGGGYKQWVLNVAIQWWQIFAVDWETMEFSIGQNSYENVMIAGFRDTPKKWHKCNSIYFYGNGGGAVSRLSAGATVAPGTTTLELTNANTAIRFDEADLLDNGSYSGGDVIQFSVDDGTGGNGPRAFKTRVIGVDYDAGTIEIFPALDGTVIASDYIFFEGTYNTVFEGLDAWNPEDVNALAGTFNGVDRTTAPQKLGGSRVVINSGDDPYGVITEACEVARKRRMKFNRFAVTPTVMRRLENSFRESGVTFAASGDVPKRLSQGIGMYKFINPSTNEEVGVFADPMLADINATAPTDTVYRGWKKEDWTLVTAGNGINWKDMTKSGTFLRQIPDSQLVKADYGGRGNFRQRNPKNLIVLSPNVVVS